MSIRKLPPIVEDRQGQSEEPLDPALERARQEDELALPGCPTDFVPEDSPIGCYLAWAKSVQGSPPVYHLAGALAFAGYTLCARGFHLQTAVERVHPTLWFALLGGAGTGKTTAVNMVEDFAKDVFAERGASFPGFVQPDGSIPGIMHVLQRQYSETRGTTVGLLFHSELAKLFATREPVPELLCQLYDGRTIQHHTITGHKKRAPSEATSVIEPRVNAVFCSAEAQLIPHFKESHRTGGMFSRLQWVRPEFHSKHIRPPVMDQVGLETSAKMRTAAVGCWADWEGRLSELEQDRKCLRILDSAAEALVLRSRAAQEALKPEDQDFLHGTRMRVLQRAYVLSMVFATCRGSLVIELEDTEAAIEIARRFYTSSVAASELGTPVQHRFKNKVEAYIKRAGKHGVYRKHLYAAIFGLTKKELDLALETLLEEELVLRANEAGMLRPGAYVHASTEIGQRAVAALNQSARLAAELGSLRNSNKFD